MKSSNRMLIGFAGGIIVLVIITIVLVFTLGQVKSPILPENTPQGVVQRYLQAVQNKDFAAAYSYLTPPSGTPDITKGPPQTFDFYVSSAQGAVRNAWKASLGKVSETGDTASVEVDIEVFTSEGPFGNAIHTNNITFFMKKSGPNWLITAPLDLYWLY
jgi:hypothetical protein